ncbi:MAG: ABC transporter permease, partial [Anaerolineales bacterium]|nr:ABC transporter permease [Anaerolineales bacterium]
MASSSNNRPPVSRWRVVALRWRKALRDLYQHRLRTLLSVLSIAIGVATFGMIMGTREIIQDDLAVAYNAIQPASAIIYGGPFDEALIESIRNMPEVALVNGRREIPVRVAVGNNNWNDMTLLALDAFDDQQVNMVRPQSGAWPPATNTMLVERQSLALFNLQQGKSAPLTLQLPSGHERTLMVTGTTHDMNQAPASIAGVGLGYITAETLPWLGYAQNYDQLHLRVAGDTTDLAHIEAVTAVVEHKLERGGYHLLRTDIPTPDTHFAADFIPAIILIFTVLGVLSLILSAFLIVNTMAAVMKQEVRQIGVLKAIGARTSDIMGLYLRMVLIFSVASLLLAVPLSVLGARLLSAFIADQLNFDLLSRFMSWRVFLLEIAAGFLVPILAALWPILGTARLTILDALTDTGTSRGTTAVSWVGTRVQTVGAWLLQPFSRPLRLTIRNTFRRRGRLALTLLTLMLGGGIFMGVMTLRASLFATLEDTLLARGMDVQVQLARPYRVPEIERTVWQVAGVTAVESWRFAPAVPVRPDAQASEGETMQVFGLPANTAVFTPDITSGRWLTATDQHAAVVHQMLLDKEPYLQVGDLLTI